MSSSKMAESAEVNEVGFTLLLFELLSQTFCLILVIQIIAATTPDIFTFSLKGCEIPKTIVGSIEKKR